MSNHRQARRTLRPTLLVPQDLALQQELLQRSSFETQKLEVMNKMSNLTLQQRTLERENMELRNRLRRAEMNNRQPVGGGVH